MKHVALDGVTYAVEQSGAGPPLVLVHGFTGSRRTWAAQVAAFRPELRTIAVDLLGHGDSSKPTDPHRYAMARAVDDLLGLLDALRVPRTAVLGYSMGGRVALHLAHAAPDRIGALVVESGSPGIRDIREREARVAADEELARSIEQDGVAAFVARWERLPLFASQAALPAAVRQRLRACRLANDPTGLAGSLRGLGAGRQAELWSVLPTLDVPTLVVAGALDAKYRDIGAAMASAMPSARLVVVPGAGHTVHLEAPDTFSGLVLEFLRSLGWSRRTAAHSCHTLASPVATHRSTGKPCGS